MGTEEAVIIAIGRHIRFKFRWDGWEEVGAKGECRWDGWCVGCGERSRGKGLKVVRCEGSRWRSWWVDMIVGACMGGDGGFVGREEGGEGGNGGVAEWDARWWPEGEGGAKMLGEGKDEGGVEIV